MPQLRDYQLDVIERVRARLVAGLRRVLIQAPTGSGKTHVSSEMTRRAFEKGKRVLFLAHRRKLVQQKAERLSEFGVPHGLLMAGVKPTAATVQVASRDTLLSRSVRNDWLDFPQADLVIVDEAHNCLAEQYQEILQRYPQSVVLGLTATPTRSDGRGLGEYYQALECTVPVSRLVAYRWLVPWRCYAPDCSGDGERIIQGDPVKHWKRFAQNRATILFADKVESSQAICHAFNSAGVPAEHMDAHTPDDPGNDVRGEMIDRLRTGRTKVLCNCSVLTEGVDIPEVGCIQIVRMAGSAIVFFQACGRGMRPSPGKEYAILIDHAGAVLKHGFPDADVEWNLDTEESVDQRIEKARKDGKTPSPIVCPQCATIFSGRITCPSCGWMAPKAVQKKTLKEKLLVEVERQESQGKNGQLAAWLRCLGIMANKGRTLGAAAAMFKGITGDWPPDSFPGAGWRDRRKAVADVLPEFVRRGRNAA